jgi:hypothetical protein
MHVSVRARRVFARLNTPDAGSGILAIPVLLLLAALVRKAWLDLDVAWDSLAYHLPFAGLRAGILSASDYRLSRVMMERYNGLPILPSLIQGFLWRVTSHIQATNLIGLAGLLPLAGLLKKVFRVPWTYSLVALLSIPVVLIQSTSSYVDLFSNCWMASMLLLILAAILHPDRFSVTRLLGVFVCFAVVLNSKMQLEPVAAAALGVFLVLLWVWRRRYARLSFFIENGGMWRKLGVASALIGLVTIGFANTAKNWIEFRNPFYPLPIVGGKIVTPGEVDTQPGYLAHSSQAFRWLLSTVEYKSFEGRRPLWTNGQGDVAIDSPALFMGGNFGALVLFNILWLGFLQSKVKDRLGWAPCWFMGVITLTTAFMPASPQSRYYMYWIVCLVLLNLILIVNSLSGERGRDARILYVGGMASFLLFVLSATGFVYVHRSRTTLKGMAEKVDKRLADAHLREGETVCMANINPFALLFAPEFHPELRAKFHYKIQEIYGAGDCEGLRPLP